MGYKTKAKYSYFTLKKWEYKGGPCYYLRIYYLPVFVNEFRWNKWDKKLRILGIGIEFQKLPF